MGYMNDEEIVRCLLDESCPIDEKAELLANRLAYHAALCRNMGMGVRVGRTIAIERLFEELPEGNIAKRKALVRVLDSIAEHHAERRAKREQEVKALGSQLRAPSSRAAQHDAQQWNQAQPTPVRRRFSGLPQD